MNKRVVIVSKSSDDVDSLVSILKGIPADIEEFQTARRALERLRHDPTPDLVVVDIHQPDVDGWRICGYLRSPHCAHMHDTPVLAITSVFRDTGFETLARNIGVDRILALPASRDSIEPWLSAAVNGTLPKRPRMAALIVEDSGPMVTMLTRGLQRYGFEIVSTGSVASAVAASATRPFDVVLVDHLLPDGNGLQVLQGIGAGQPTFPGIAVGFTALAEPELSIQYLEVGAHAFLRKPMSIEYLIEVIRRAQHHRALLQMEQILVNSIAAVNDAERRFRDLYENAPLGYHTLDASGTVVSMNATELRWLGYAHDELVGKKTVFDLQTPSSADRGRRVFDELKRHGELRNIELEFLRKDGTVLPVLIDACAMHDSSGRTTAIRTIVRDNTELKRMEEHLRHTQKMESISVLSAGIAHNFNNLLTPILANASHLLEEFADEPEIAEVLQDIMGAAKRGSHLVEQVAALSHTATSSFAPVAIDTLIHDTVGMLSKTFEKNIRIDSHIARDIPAVAGSYTQIQQAFVNLCFNARDAMPRGGLILVDVSASSSPPSAEERIGSAHRRAGLYVVVSVSDHGPGIPRAIQNRIFDPFFTTKGRANRLGLGLTLVDATMRDHGGFIQVHSEENEGTRFRLYFPVLEPTPQDDKTDLVAEHVDLGTVERIAKPASILIVEDDAFQRRSASRILRRCGYKVIEAADGLEALDVTRRSISPVESSLHPESEIPRVDLVILDVMLHGMSGEHVLEKIRAIRSGLPVIAISSLANAAKISDLMKLGARDVLVKPFNRITLLHAVERGLVPPQKANTHAS